MSEPDVPDDIVLDAVQAVYTREGQVRWLALWQRPPLWWDTDDMPLKDAERAPFQKQAREKMERDVMAAAFYRQRVEAKYRRGHGQEGDPPTTDDPE